MGGAREGGQETVMGTALVWALPITTLVTWGKVLPASGSGGLESPSDNPGLSCLFFAPEMRS